MHWSLRVVGRGMHWSLEPSYISTIKSGEAEGRRFRHALESSNISTTTSGGENAENGESSVERKQWRRAVGQHGFRWGRG